MVQIYPCAESNSIDVR